MFQFVDQLLVVVQFQFVHSVDQTLDVSHSWQEEEELLKVSMETLMHFTTGSVNKWVQW